MLPQFSLIGKNLLFDGSSPGCLLSREASNAVEGHAVGRPLGGKVMKGRGKRSLGLSDRAANHSSATCKLCGFEHSAQMP